MSTFVLVRHGQTDAVDRWLAGTAAGVSLNGEGREQAREVGAQLAPVPLAAVVSSPLDRARETAAAIAAPHALDVALERRLSEFEVGAWTGVPLATLDAQDDWRRFNSVRSLARPPSGELMIDVQRRAVEALLELAQKHPGGNVAVVSHGDVIRALVMYFLGMPIDFVHRLEIRPARISVVEIGAGQPVVRQVNGDSALLLA